LYKTIEWVTFTPVKSNLLKRTIHTGQNPASFCIIEALFLRCRFTAQTKNNYRMRWLSYIAIICLFASCASFKKQVKTGGATASTVPGTKPVFIEGIEIKPEYHPEAMRTKTSGKTSARNFAVKNSAAFSSPLETYSINQIRFALRMDVPVEVIQNKFLYDFINDWWSTPYRLGGTTSRGIDCSAFVQTLMASVFSLSLPRTTREQFSAAQRIDDTMLSEGDLVFFSTVRKGVSHVGVYLHNQKFVHASTSGGVMISDLHDVYWGRRYIGAGRVLSGTFPKP
jgi:cell wall-associated NlpC family hydrolase